MRILVSFLLASIPVSAGIVDPVSVTCDGIVYPGSDSCSVGNPALPGAYAMASPELAVAGVWGVGSSGDDNVATASITEEYVLTVTGGSGSAFAEPFLDATGQAINDASAGATGSLGQCYVNTMEGNNLPCQWDALAFVFDNPQVVTLFLSAGAVADSVNPLVTSQAMFTGFEFFDVNGQPLSGISYTFTPVGQSTPEPGTSALTVMASAALLAFARRRAR